MAADLILIYLWWFLHGFVCYPNSLVAIHPYQTLLVVDIYSFLYYFNQRFKGHHGTLDFRIVYHHTCLVFILIAIEFSLIADWFYLYLTSIMWSWVGWQGYPINLLSLLLRPLFYVFYSWVCCAIHAKPYH